MKKAKTKFIYVKDKIKDKKVSEAIEKKKGIINFLLNKANETTNLK